MIVSNEREERQQWLNGLQVGDEVAVYKKGFGVKYLICRVEKITPTRRFRLDALSFVFDSSGKEMGAGSWGSDSMERVTDRIREGVARNNALSFIKNINFNTLTTQQLLDVLKIIKPDELK